MKRRTKLALITAVSLIILGIAVSLAALAMGGGTMERSAAIYELHTYEINEAFSGITVRAEEADVCLTASEDGTCRVICSESEKVNYRVAVEDGTLRVTCEDNRLWYDWIGVSFDDTKLKVEISLPENRYDALQLASISGDLAVPANLMFETARLETTSGSIQYCAVTAGSLEIESVSGDILVRGSTAAEVKATATSGSIAMDDLTVDGSLAANVVSGEIEISDIHCETFHAESTSGSIRCKDLTAAGELTASAVSGDIELLHCDAEAIKLETVSGDIAFPRTTSDGVCEITTVSGDISADAE